MASLSEKWKSSSLMFKMLVAFVVVAASILLIISVVAENLTTVLMFAVFWILIPVWIVAAAIRHLFPAKIVSKLPPDSTFPDEIAASQGQPPRIRLDQ